MTRLRPKMGLGSPTKVLRVEKNHSLTDVAHLIGCSKTLIWRVEHGLNKWDHSIYTARFIKYYGSETLIRNEEWRQADPITRLALSAEPKGVMTRLCPGCGKDFVAPHSWPYKLCDGCYSQILVEA